MTGIPDAISAKSPEGTRPALIHSRGCEDCVNIGCTEIRCKGGHRIISPLEQVIIAAPCEEVDGKVSLQAV